MANNSNQRGRVRIGKDGRIYVDDTGSQTTRTHTSQTRGSASGPSRGSGNDSSGSTSWLEWVFGILIIVAILYWTGVLPFGESSSSAASSSTSSSSSSSSSTYSYSSTSAIDGEWQIIGSSGGLVHEIYDGVDHIYDVSQPGRDRALLSTETVTSLGRFDSSEFDLGGAGQAFQIGYGTYLLYDSDSDVLVCRNLDGTGYSVASSLHRIG